MSEAPRQEIKLFYCYAREDKALRVELGQHFNRLKSDYQLIDWYDREILPGEEWEQSVDEHLTTADLILLLISPYFMNSGYSRGQEVQRALAGHQAGTCRVIPILLRPTHWEDAPFSSLQFLPTNARPVTRWSDQDMAFQDVAMGISRAIKDPLPSFKTKMEWLEEGNRLSDLKRYEEALAAYEQAIRLDPDDATAYNNKSAALIKLKRYEEALIALEQAIRLDPKNAVGYTEKGAALDQLGRYEEALIALVQAVQLDPNNTLAHKRRGAVLNKLGRYEEALAAYEQAIRLDPDDVTAYTDKAAVLNKLKRYEEALITLEQAIRLDPNYACALPKRFAELNQR
ncbi:MAG TPA: tetratricopeptide repeat protein [Ktedonobacteraceae bacterium]|nr:tetratricopeptide repeat protein [Ktedonobacteraceae bacterium]